MTLYRCHGNGTVHSCTFNSLGFVWLHNNNWRIPIPFTLVSKVWIEYRHLVFIFYLFFFRPKVQCTSIKSNALCTFLKVTWNNTRKQTFEFSFFIFIITVEQRMNLIETISNDSYNFTNLGLDTCSCRDDDDIQSFK